MDFEVSEQMETILTMVREFVDNELVPIEGEMLHGSPETVQELVVAAQGKVRQMGLWAPNHPEEFGGLGLSMIDHGLLSEALGRSPLGHTVFGSQAPDAGNIEILHLHATDEQRERFLRPLVEGTIRSCFSMTEPETAGSNPLLLETTAVKDGNDYVINGQKWFTSSADGASFAIVMAVTDPDAPPYARTSMIIVPTDTPGFNLVRNVSVMGHAGSGHASHGEVIYQACRVPQTNLLGPEGGGFVIAQERLGPGRIHHCMRWLGIASRAFDMMCERANARVISPDGDTLADRQVIQHWVAELDAEIRGARLQTLHAAWMIDQHGPKAARDEISAIKFSVANTMLKAVDTAIQVHGALGVTDDTILAYWYRHERAARIYDGADEVHKTTLGRRILRRYAAAR
ncbi:MAG TPA: acyl-CoA dehydrogenase family protein [Ilumatobacteraceae bacterium]|nr:acyl-CoA dehydrogenase family protein [Ilumatobacteraceae bacterium]